MAPPIKVQIFIYFLLRGHVFVSFFSGKLGEMWASLGEIWAKMVLEVCFDFKKCAQHEKKCSRFFWSSFSLEFFRASLGKFWQKFFAPQKFASSYTYVGR